MILRVMVQAHLFQYQIDNAQLELWNKLNEGNTLPEIQNYIKEVIKIRGFDEQKIEKTMLLLLEEVGELAI